MKKNDVSFYCVQTRLIGKKVPLYTYIFSKLPKTYLFIQFTCSYQLEWTLVAVKQPTTFFCYQQFFFFFTHTQHNIQNTTKQTTDTYSTSQGPIKREGEREGQQEHKSHSFIQSRMSNKKHCQASMIEGLAPPTRAVVHSHDTTPTTFIPFHTNYDYRSRLSINTDIFLL